MIQQSGFLSHPFAPPPNPDMQKKTSTKRPINFTQSINFACLIYLKTVKKTLNSIDYLAKPTFGSTSNCKQITGCSELDKFVHTLNSIQKE